MNKFENPITGTNGIRFGEKGEIHKTKEKKNNIEFRIFQIVH